jgi:hypothetical protein
VTLLLNLGGAEAARSEITRAALDWVGGDAARRMNSTAAAPRPVPGGYQSTYWGLRADVSVDEGVPVVTIASSSLSAAESVSRLTEAGGRWRADRGMFDGCELDFEAVDGGRSFYGGLYPFEFVGADTKPAALPASVDETGDLTGRWTGTIDTPVGPVPIELVVGSGSVAVELLEVGGADREAETDAGWIRARVDLDIVGFGAIVVFARLGLVADRLEGQFSVRHSSGELTLPAVLGRPGSGTGSEP